MRYNPDQVGGNRTGGNLLESHDDDDDDDIGGEKKNIDDYVEVPSSYPCIEE